MSQGDTRYILSPGAVEDKIIGREGIPVLKNELICKKLKYLILL